MKVKAVCKVHPEATVYLLEATTKFLDVNEQYTTEQSERASIVELDIANLYCTADDPHNHDIVFKVYNTDGHWLCDAE